MIANITKMTSDYIGRFAPSPTGPLHFGSLVTALASYCDAKANGGLWLLRIEDVDLPRTVNGAAKLIIDTLSAYGFDWDQDIVYQSARNALYAENLAKLKSLNLAYPCTCSRKEITEATSSIGEEGPIYPKTCLSHALKQNTATAWRVKTDNQLIHFHDAIQGIMTQNMAKSIGDFVVLRADQLYAYQLAVVTDDALQGVTHIVRGADLLSSTPRQIYLQQLLGFKTPDYAHIPLICNKNGEKLSKQTLAEPIDINNATKLLVQALAHLNQNPPSTLTNERSRKILLWAIEHWQPDQVPSNNIIFKGIKD